MRIFKFDEFSKIDEEALPQKKTVDQLKMVRKLSKGIDIGDRISNMNKEGQNITWIRNPIDTGIETQQDYDKSNRKFKQFRHIQNRLNAF